MKKKILLNSLFCIFVAAFIFSAYKIYDIQTKYKQGRDEYDSIFEHAYIPPESVHTTENTDTTGAGEAALGVASLVNFQALKELNSDYVGWLDIPGSSISYPIVSCGNNDYYLNHTFKNNYNEAGCIFLDYRTADLSARNVIIYGHRMKDGSMFADLGKYLDEAHYSEYREVHIYTKTELLVYEVFSVREVYTYDSCYNLNFADNTAFGAWLKQMKSNSLYETDLEPVDSAGVITLSTCVTGNRELRCIVQAQLVGKYQLVNPS